MTAQSLYPILSCAGLCSGRTVHICVGGRPGTSRTIYRCEVCAREQDVDQHAVPAAAHVTPLVGARPTIDESSLRWAPGVASVVAAAIAAPNDAVELVRELERESGVVAKVTGNGAAAVDTPDLAADNARLRAELASVNTRWATRLELLEARAAKARAVLDGGKE